MNHDVYILYCSGNKAIAKLVCAALESNGIDCWITYRNLGGKSDCKKIIEKAINVATVMLIVFSNESNESIELANETNIAINADLIVIPLRVNMADPKGVMQYYLSDTQWLDIIEPPTEKHLAEIVSTVKQVLKRNNNDAKERAYFTVKKGKLFNVKVTKIIAGFFWFAGSIVMIYGLISIMQCLRRLSESIGSFINASF